MARPCLDRNPKFKLLVRRVESTYPKASKATARGALELVWDAANECGDPRFKSREYLLAVIEVSDEAIVDALIEIGFLDVLDDGSLVIHDFWDHAPDYVRKRRKRENDRLAHGLSLATGHVATGQRTVGDQSLTGRCPQNGSPPAPAPAPAPAHGYTENPPYPPASGENGIVAPKPRRRISTALEVEGPERDAFEAWRAVYPVRGWLGTGAAEAAWVKARKGGATVEAIMSGAAAWSVADLWLNPDLRICAPAVWLNQRRWLDAPPPAKHWQHVKLNAADDVLAAILEEHQ